MKTYVLRWALGLILITSSSFAQMIIEHEKEIYAVSPILNNSLLAKLSGPSGQCGLGYNLGLAKFNQEKILPVELQYLVDKELYDPTDDTQMVDKFVLSCNPLGTSFPYFSLLLVATKFPGHRHTYTLKVIPVYVLEAEHLKVYPQPAAEYGSFTWKNK